MTNIRLSNIDPSLGKSIKLAAIKANMTVGRFVLECIILELDRRADTTTRKQSPQSSSGIGPDGTDVSHW